MSPLDLVPAPYRAAALAGAVVALLAIGGGVGWSVNGWRLGTAIATERQAWATATAKAAKEASDQRDALAGKLATLDKTSTDNLRRLTDENETLRGRVRAGAVRVRVPGAVCPDLSQAPAGSGVDSGTGAVLTPEAGQDFLDLRRDAIRLGVKLDACQAALGTLTGQ